MTALLLALAAAARAATAPADVAAEPFPHVVVDGLLLVIGSINR